jgi:subtilisin family serine protease
MRRFLLASLVLLAVGSTAVLGLPSLSPHYAQPLASTPALAQVGPAQAGERTSVFVELADVPAATLVGPQPTSEQLAAAQAQAQLISLAHSALAPQLAALDAQELFRARLSANGIAVSVDRARLPQLRALPGVVAVRPLPPKQLAASASLPAVGAPAAWASGTGTAGEGIRVGVADTGVDYSHAAFGGPGTSVSFAANDPALVELASFPTGKVIGGLDLAGDSYDAFTNPVPQPDADPLDCQGHGSAVAAIIASLGVTLDGQTYRGAYTNALDLSQFRVAPGIAPRAALFAIKIFGCSGSTALTIAALDAALDPDGDGNMADRLDVLSLAVASPFTGYDVDASAADVAFGAGLLIVTPAGNHGNTFYSLASPATARGALAVAATDDARALATAPSIADFSARGPSRRGALLKPDLAAPGIGVQTAAKGTGTGVATFSGSSIAAAHVAGAAALLVQRHPDWTAAQIKAALITTARPLSTAAGPTYPPSLAGAGLLAVERAATTDLLAFASSGEGAVGLSFGTPYIAEPLWVSTRTITLANSAAYDRLVRLRTLTYNSQSGVSVTPLSDTVRLPAGGSAEVPIRASIDAAQLSALPDPFTPLLQLPGIALARHALAEHNGAIAVADDGLTMLRLAQFADLVPVDLYVDGTEVLTNVAQGDVTAYLELAPGQRRVQVFPIGARGSGQPLVEQLATINPGQPVTLAITGWTAELRSLLLDDSFVAPAPGSAAQLRPISGVSSVLGPIDIYANGSLIASRLAPGRAGSYISLPSSTPIDIQIRRAGAPAASQPLLTSRLTLQEGQRVDLAVTGRSALRLNARTFENPLRASQELRLPFSLAPVLAASARVANTTPITLGAADSLTLTIRNGGPRNNPDPTSGQLPVLSIFELAAFSPDEPAADLDSDAADLRYVGVASNFGEVDPDSTSVFFGIATYATWATPHDLRFRVEIDTNADSIADARVESTDLGQLQTPARTSDIFVAASYRRDASGQYVYTGEARLLNGIQAPNGATGLHTNVYNSSVLFLPSPLRALLPSGPAPFRYRVLTFLQAGDTPVDQTGWLDYDPTRPRFSAINRGIGFLPLHADLDDSRIPVSVSRSALATSGGSLLLLHHHNLPGAQAELLPVAP